MMMNVLRMAFAVLLAGIMLPAWVQTCRLPGRITDTQPIQIKGQQLNRPTDYHVLVFSWSPV
jgi:ribonuclease I